MTRSERDVGEAGSAASAARRDTAHCRAPLRRARRRRDRGPATFDGHAEVVESLPADGLQRGARIFHRKFGYGTVAKVEGDRLVIEFDKAGRKKVIAGFVVPADRAE